MVEKSSVWLLIVYSPPNHRHRTSREIPRPKIFPFKLPRLLNGDMLHIMQKAFTDNVEPAIEDPPKLDDF